MSDFYKNNENFAIINKKIVYVGKGAVLQMIEEGARNSVETYCLSCGARDKYRKSDLMHGRIIFCKSCDTLYIHDFGNAFRVGDTELTLKAVQRTSNTDKFRYSYEFNASGKDFKVNNKTYNEMLLELAGYFDKKHIAEAKQIVSQECTKFDLDTKGLEDVNAPECKIRQESTTGGQDSVSNDKNGLKGIQSDLKGNQQTDTEDAKQAKDVKIRKRSKAVGSIDLQKIFKGEVPKFNHGDSTAIGNMIPLDSTIDEIATRGRTTGQEVHKRTFMCKVCGDYMYIASNIMSSTATRQLLKDADTSIFTKIAHKGYSNSSSGRTEAYNRGLEFFRDNADDIFNYIAVVLNMQSQSNKNLEALQKKEEKIRTSLEKDNTDIDMRYLLDLKPAQLQLLATFCCKKHNMDNESARWGFASTSEIDKWTGKIKNNLLVNSVRIRKYGIPYVNCQCIFCGRKNINMRLSTFIDNDEVRCPECDNYSIRVECPGCVGEDGKLLTKCRICNKDTDASIKTNHLFEHRNPGVNYICPKGNSNINVRVDSLIRSAKDFIQRRKADIITEGLTYECNITSENGVELTKYQEGYIARKLYTSEKEFKENVEMHTYYCSKHCKLLTLSDEEARTYDCKFCDDDRMHGTYCKIKYK